MTERRTALEHERSLLRAALRGTGGREVEASPGAASGSPHADEATIASYLTGELEAEAIERFERHVAACSACADELVLAVRLERRWASAPPTAAPASQTAPASTTAPAGAASTSADPLPRASDPYAAVSTSSRARTRAAHPPASPRRRWARRFALAASLVLVVTTSLLAMGTQAVLERLRPELASSLGASLGRRVEIGHLGVAVLGGLGLRAQGFGVEDDPQFSQGNLVTVDSGVLRADLAALLRGRLEGAVAVDGATLRLVRIAGGAWNVEALGGRSGDGSGSDAAPDLPGAGGAARADGVRLTSATVRNGRLEVKDRGRSGAARDLVVSKLDLAVDSPDPRRTATLEMKGTLAGKGDRHTIAVSGEIGPFTRGTTPRWDLERVELAGIPVGEIPGAPEVLGGELTFRGSLESSGDDLHSVIENATGAGEIGLANGSLADGNVGRDLITAFAAEVASGSGDAAAEMDRAILAAADGVLGAMLRAPATDFRSLGGKVELAPRGIELAGVTFETGAFVATASGSLSRAGDLRATGRVVVEPALAAAIVRAAPIVRPLVDPSGRITAPFRASGAWPDIALDLDLAQAVAAARHLDPRNFTLSLFALVSGRRDPRPAA